MVGKGINRIAGDIGAYRRTATTLDHKTEMLHIGRFDARARISLRRLGINDMGGHAAQLHTIADIDGFETFFWQPLLAQIIDALNWPNKLAFGETLVDG